VRGVLACCEELFDVFTSAAATS